VKQASYVVVGAFINRQALADWISKQDKNVVILCSGWYNQFNLEDTLFAGALTEALSEKRLFSLRYDSTQAALDLWRIAKKDLMGYIEKASHRHRLRKLGLDDILEYSLTLDISKVIPVIDGIRLINAGL
jgi:2-phosphosulfolactate phosphatase